MIDHSKDIAAVKSKSRIRMAYSLNGTQPVLCTLLCDQPLYYMDEEIFEEDDSVLLAEEESLNAALGLDLYPLQKKIGIYDGIARKFAISPDARLEQFIENGRDFGRAQKRQTLDDLLAAARESRYVQSLITMAEDNNITIQASAQTRSADFNSTIKTILINLEQAPCDALLSLVSALRKYAQISQNAGAHPLTYHPDEAVFVNRAQVADIMVAQVRAAWEWQLAGINAPWARLENTQGCDIARAYAREALCDFRAINNGKAAQAAFESWFLSDRCKIEDRELIQSMLADQEARTFEEPINNLGPSFIAALGEQGMGKNYLAEQAGTLLSDPIFSDVRDRSNANFLWFVKFERAYKNTEESLQEEAIHSLEAEESNDSNIVYVSFGRSC